MFSLRSHISGPAASTFWTSLTFWRHFGDRETFWKKSCGTWAPGKAQEPFSLFLTSILAYFSNSGKTQHLWGLVKKKLFCPSKELIFLFYGLGCQVKSKAINALKGGQFWPFLVIFGHFRHFIFDKCRNHGKYVHVTHVWTKKFCQLQNGEKYIFWTVLSGRPDGQKLN